MRLKGLSGLGVTTSEPSSSVVVGFRPDTSVEVEAISQGCCGRLSGSGSSSPTFLNIGVGIGSPRR